jgi:penicillin V acylase-like amidase (Ntn superfamily)
MPTLISNIITPTNVVVTPPGTAGQQLTSNGTAWTSKYGIILSNLTLYVATTGNDTTETGLTVGTPGTYDSETGEFTPGTPPMTQAEVAAIATETLFQPE